MKKYKIAFLLFAFSFSQYQILSQSDDDNSKGKLSEGLRAFVQEGKMGFMNEKNAVVCLPTFDTCEDGYIPFFSDGMCLFYEMVRDQNNPEGILRYGFINNKFQKVIPAIFPYKGTFLCSGFPTTFKEGFAVVNDSKANSDEDFKFLVINKSGKQVGNSFQYSDGCLAACSYFPQISDGFCVGSNSNGYGYIEVASGKTFLANKFTLLGPFSDGIAAAEVDGKYLIFINKKGEQVFDKKFYLVKKGGEQQSLYSTFFGCSHPGGFVKGKMIVVYYENNGAGPMILALIDKQGNFIIKKEIDADNSGGVSPFYPNDPAFDPYVWKF